MPTMADFLRIDSYPWWPAVIYEDDDPQIPTNIVEICLAERKKLQEPVHILQFFDKHKSWYVA